MYEFPTKCLNVQAKQSSYIIWSVELHFKLNQLKKSVDLIILPFLKVPSSDILSSKIVNNKK